MSKSQKQYFSRYAESEVDVLASHESLLPDDFAVEHVVVIPAYQETNAFIERFIASSLATKPVLMVVVINEPISKDREKQDLIASPSTRLEESLQQQLHQYVLSCGENCWQHENLTLIKVGRSQAWILVVDRFTYPIESEQGVGLARKIGTDLSAYLISINRIKHSWICSSDADAYLPDEYFNALASRNKRTVVCCYNFQHSCDNKTVHQANRLYETALRYYVAGLAYANSPYAFFTIGSTLAFRADGYIQARGFPKRSAGEDFYLLNKLAKLGDVEFIADVVVNLEARVSTRVPFGTGPAVQRIIDLQTNNLDYCYYNPEVFQQLKITLSAFSQLWRQRYEIETWQGALADKANEALKDIHFDKFIAKQLNSNEVQFNKQLSVWFDAFKTLKFIHFLRDNYYPDIPLNQAVSNRFFDF